MKNSTKLSIATAALSGLLMGTAARAATATVPATHENAGMKKAIDPGQKAIKYADEKKEVKKHDCAGKNDCKGQGGCKSSDNGCKGKNSCKGKGGCATNMDDKKKKE